MNEYIDKLVTIPVEYTVYTGTDIYDSVLPTGLKWVKYDGVIFKSYYEHVNYWTCVENNYHNLRMAKQIEESNLHMHVEYFKDFIFFILKTCESIDIFEEVSYKEIEEYFHLKDITVVNIDLMYACVSEVFHLNDLYHPECANISVYTLYDNDIEAYSAIIHRSVDLYDWINSGHNKSIILHGDKSLDIRKKAIAKVIHEISGISLNINDDINWNVPNYNEMIANIKTLDRDNLADILFEKNKLINQFTK